MLQLVAEHAHDVADAALVAILLYEKTTGEPHVEVTVPRNPELDGALIPLVGTPFEEVAAGGHLLVDALNAAASWPPAVPGGPALLAPLAMTGTVQGILVVGLDVDSAGFDGDTDVSMITTFAGQAALALERARAQDEREQLMVLADRERIARDLHGVVIQRLFATGLGLQALTCRAQRDDVRERLDQAIDELDTTIRDIRTAIFALHTPSTDSLRAALLAAIEEAVQILGFRPNLTVTGPIDLAVADALRADLLAVLGEALSNVTRHARANTVTVYVTIGSGRLTLRVADDGIGTTGSGPTGCGGGNGLVNLRSRAERRGGICTVTQAVPHGTVVTWAVPLDG